MEKNQELWEKIYVADFELIENQYKIMNIPPRFQSALYNHVSNKRNVKRCYDFICEFEESRKTRSFLFIGGPEVGKTSLAVTMLKQLQKSRRGNGFYIVYNDMLAMRENPKPIDPEYPAYTDWGYLKDSDLLVIDDIGLENFGIKVNEMNSFLLNLFLARFNNFQTTILISHMDVEDMSKKYGDVMLQFLSRKATLVNL